MIRIKEGNQSVRQSKKQRFHAGRQTPTLLYHKLSYMSMNGKVKISEPKYSWATQHAGT